MEENYQRFFNKEKTYCLGKEEVLVTVCCLTYNHEKYIRSALDGFVKQKTNFPYKIIVHDDASTDNTVSIIKEYVKRFPDLIIPIFQKVNQYSQKIDLIETSILERLCGRYVAMCEGDDFWCDEYKLQKQVDFLEKNVEYSACVHNSIVMNLKTNENRILNQNVWAYDLKIEDILCERVGCQSSSYMYRTEYAIELYSASGPRFYKIIRNFGDWQTLIFLGIKGKIRYMPEVMSVYRYCVEGSWTQRNIGAVYQIKVLEDEIRVLKEVNIYTNKKYQSIISELIDKKNVEKEYRKLLYERNYKAILSDSRYKELLNKEDRIYVRRMYWYLAFPFLVSVKNWIKFKIQKNKRDLI